MKWDWRMWGGVAKQCWEPRDVGGALEPRGDTDRGGETGGDTGTWRGSGARGGCRGAGGTQALLAITPPRAAPRTSPLPADFSPPPRRSARPQIYGFYFAGLSRHQSVGSASRSRPCPSPLLMAAPQRGGEGGGGRGAPPPPALMGNSWPERCRGAPLGPSISPLLLQPVRLVRSGGRNVLWRGSGWLRSPSPLPGPPPPPPALQSPVRRR